MKKTAKGFSVAILALLLLVTGQSLWAAQMMESVMTAHKDGQMKAEAMKPKMANEMSGTMDKHETKKMMTESKATKEDQMMVDHMKKSDDNGMMDTMKKDM